MITARREAAAVGAAMRELRRVAPNVNSYVAEADYFQQAWQQAFWGSNYVRLAAIKRKYDPIGLFYVHHGVGSGQWTQDGFVRAALGPERRAP